MGLWCRHSDTNGTSTQLPRPLAGGVPGEPGARGLGVEDCSLKLTALGPLLSKDSDHGPRVSKERGQSTRGRPQVTTCGSRASPQEQKPDSGLQYFGPTNVSSSATASFFATEITSHRANRHSTPRRSSAAPQSPRMSFDLLLNRYRGYSYQ